MTSHLPQRGGLTKAGLYYKDKDKWFLWSLTYNPLTVSLSSAQLLNAER